MGNWVPGITVKHHIGVDVGVGVSPPVGSG